jgi:Toprim-like
VNNLEVARSYLRERGIEEAIVKAAGLRLGSGELAGRIEFGWFDERGAECYRTGRALNGTGPKYKHSRGERPSLFASPGAWGAVRVALVEGQLDALACAQAGTSAFATSGSSLSDAAVAILAGKEEVILALDGDDAGRRLTDEAIDKLAGRVELLVVTWPEGIKDAAEVAERARAAGQDPTEAVADVLSEARQPDLTPKERVASGQVGMPKIPAAELASTGPKKIPTLSFLGRQGYIVQKAATLVTSYPKGGKTTLVSQLIKEWAVQGHRILYLTEENRWTWEHRLQGEGWSGIDFGFALGLDPKLIFEAAFTGNHDILVIDTLRNVLAFEEETNNSEIAAAVNPWIVEARNTNRTFIGLSHATKAGGEHGRGIAGGHALFASFDGAIEIQRVPNISNRRQVKVLARLIAPSDLVYERGDDDTLSVLGEVQEVEQEEVKRRLKDVLTGEWMTRKQILDSLSEPRPGATTVRLALEDLVLLGEARRDPPEDKRGATYRFRTSPDATLP